MMGNPHLAFGWQPSTPQITGEEAPAVLAQHRVVVIHFWAKWDGYDMVADRDLQPLRDEFGDRAYFCSCDVDEEPSWPFIRSCEVFGVPWLVCFVDGERVPTRLHYRSLGVLREVLTQALANVEDALRSAQLAPE